MYVCVHSTVKTTQFILHTIKTSGSESRGQEEAACMRVLGLCDHYSELFTRMKALNF